MGHSSLITINQGFGSRIVACDYSQFAHQFGGGEHYFGTTPKEGHRPIQLLFRLNLDDPEMPVKMTGIQWLPLFFPFQYDGSPLGYRVVSDQEIEILTLEHQQYLTDFPFPDFSEVFTEIPVKLVPVEYKEQRALVFCNFLDRHHMEKSLLSEEDKGLIVELGTEFTKIGGGHDLIQGYPNEVCPYTKCSNHNCRYAMETFATVWNEPIKGVDVWQSGGEPIQIVYQICPRCGSIYALNQCS